MKKVLLLFLTCAVFFSSCVMSTRVTIETVPSEAEVYVDGKLIGESPVTEKMSNAFWEDPDILIKKEGYDDLRTDLDKEIITTNLIAGLLLWFPSLLWVYGPDEDQRYILSEE